MTQSFTREPVSVCMATYNGEKFLKAQIESILVQFECKDESVIVDDSSTDATHEIILSFQDPRIILHVNIENIHTYTCIIHIYIFYMYIHILYVYTYSICIYI